MDVIDGRNFYRITCEKCKIFLCEAPEGSSTRCPRCYTWIPAGNVENEKEETTKKPSKKGAKKD